MSITQDQIEQIYTDIEKDKFQLSVCKNIDNSRKYIQHKRFHEKKQHKKPRTRKNKQHKQQQCLLLEWNMRKNFFRETVERYAFSLNDNEWNHLTREAYDFMYEYPTKKEGCRMYLILKKRPFIKIKAIDIAVFNWYSWVYGPRGNDFFNNNK